VGKWDQKRRKPKHRKVIRKKPDIYTDRMRRIRTTEREEADELEQLDKEMRIRGQW